jgi:hypothetical protein
VSLRLEFFSKFDEIIYFTIEYDMHAAVFVADRLAASLQIYDAQATVPECDVVGQERPGPIRASVAYALCHPLEEITVRLISVYVTDAGDSAHQA